MTNSARRFRLVCVALALLTPVAARAYTRDVSLVQAFAPCTASNAVHPGTPGSFACAPAVPLSTYRLERTGRIRLTSSNRSLRISVDLPLVLDASGVPVAYSVPGHHTSFTAWVDVRVTDGLCAGDPSCTVQDARIRVPVPCSRGKCSSLSTSEKLRLEVKPQTFEVRGIEVVDDRGNLLAVQGLTF